MWALFKKPKPGKVRPLVFISMDGWGMAPPSRGNAIFLAKPGNFYHLQATYPHGTVIASGESVGLPANEVGNSEVGHLTQGVGRVIFQSLERINYAIRDESIYQNQVLLNAVTRVKAKKGTLHLVGLIGSGNVHSSYPHLLALLELCKRTQCSNVLIHVITDGRDSPPQEGKGVIDGLNQHLKDNLGFGRIASVGGRYFAMDRDGRWERVQQGYEAIVIAKGKVVKEAGEAFYETYTAGKSDEFVPPTVVVGENGQPHQMSERDEVVYFNFRVDRARELTMALVMPDFEQIDTQKYGFDPHQSGFALGSGGGVTTFKRGFWPKGIQVTTMTEYQKGLPVAGVVFPPEEKIANSVSELVSRAGWQQIKLAESEKERMVTYYFDGMQDTFPNEVVDIVSSPKVATYDLKPEMAVFDIVSHFKKALMLDRYKFMMINFANPDMVAHTGNLEATVKAIKATDLALGEVVKATLAVDGMVVVSADHGNSEELITFPTGTYFFTSSSGTVNTDHSNNPIPFLVISNQFEGKPTDLGKGVMSDIAPTLLILLGLPIPKEMTGKSLINIK